MNEVFFPSGVWSVNFRLGASIATTVAVVVIVSTSYPPLGVCTTVALSVDYIALWQEAVTRTAAGSRASAAHFNDLALIELSILVPLGDSAGPSTTGPHEQ